MSEEFGSGASDDRAQLAGEKRRRKFTSRSTALEVVAGVDLSGKTVLVTGSNSGIGIETARTLALIGAHIVMANRNDTESAKVRDDILKEKPDAKVDLLHVDLSSLQSVQDAAKEYLSKGWPLHILILNAGVFASAVKTTFDGYEMAFGVNHLGHFYFTYLLLDRIRHSAPARIVVLSSISHNHSGLSASMPTEEKLKNLMPSPALFADYRLYACSKLCNMLMAMKLHRSEFDNGIKVYAVHPGTMINTGISRRFGLPARIFGFLTRPFTKSLQQGAATTVYCAASDDVSEESGKYFENCWDDEKSLAKDMVHDEALQDALWAHSLELIDKFERSQESKQG